MIWQSYNLKTAAKGIITRDDVYNGFKDLSKEENFLLYSWLKSPEIKAAIVDDNLIMFAGNRAYFKELAVDKTASNEDNYLPCWITDVEMTQGKDDYLSYDWFNRSSIKLNIYVDQENPTEEKIKQVKWTAASEWFDAKTQRSQPEENYVPTMDTAHYPLEKNSPWFYHKNVDLRNTYKQILDGLLSGSLKTTASVLDGGLGRGFIDKMFDENQLHKGIMVELEHTDDPEIAKEIAKDHLVEIPDYYDRLDLMEEGAGLLEPKEYVFIQNKEPKVNRVSDTNTGIPSITPKVNKRPVFQVNKKLTEYPDVKPSLKPTDTPLYRTKAGAESEILRKLRPLETLWLEDELGNKLNFSNGKTPDDQPEGFDYMHSRIPVLKEELLYGNKAVFSGETTLNCIGDIVVSLVQNYGWNFTDAIVLAASTCERCLNILTEEATGEVYNKEDKLRCNTHCELCSTIDPEYHKTYIEQHPESASSTPLFKNSSITKARYLFHKLSDLLPVFRPDQNDPLPFAERVEMGPMGIVRESPEALDMVTHTSVKSKDGKYYIEDYTGRVLLGPLTKEEAKDALNRIEYMK